VDQLQRYYYLAHLLLRPHLDEVERAARHLSNALCQSALGVWYKGRIRPICYLSDALDARYHDGGVPAPATAYAFALDDMERRGLIFVRRESEIVADCERERLAQSALVWDPGPHPNHGPPLDWARVSARGDGRIANPTPHVSPRPSSGDALFVPSDMLAEFHASGRQLTRQQLTAPTLADGPFGGSRFRWQGNECDIAKGNVYRILAFMWGRESATYQAIEAALDTIVSGATMVTYFGRVNRTLAKIGVPARLKGDAKTRWVIWGDAGGV